MEARGGHGLRLERNRTRNPPKFQNLISLKFLGNPNVCLRASILGKHAGEQLVATAIECIRTQHPLSRHDLAL